MRLVIATDTEYEMIAEIRHESGSSERITVENGKPVEVICDGSVDVSFHENLPKSALGRFLYSFLELVIYFAVTFLSHDEVDFAEFRSEAMHTSIGFAGHDVTMNLLYKEVVLNYNKKQYVGIVEADENAEIVEYKIDAELLKKEFEVFSRKPLFIMIPGFLILLAGMILCLNSFFIGFIILAAIFMLCTVAVSKYLKKAKAYPEELISVWTLWVKQFNVK